MPPKQCPYPQRLVWHTPRHDERRQASLRVVGVAERLRRSAVMKLRLSWTLVSTTGVLRSQGFMSGTPLRFDLSLSLSLSVSFSVCLSLSLL